MRLWFWRRRATAKPSTVPPDAQKLLFGAAPAVLAPPPVSPGADPGPTPGPEISLPEFGLGDALALVAAGRVDAGLAAYERIATLEPVNAEVWFRIGILGQELGDEPGALLAWERAVACEPTHWRASLRLATTLEGLGFPLRAVECLLEALLHAPHPGELSVNLSTFYGRLAWWDRANEVLAKLERPLPGWWEQAARHAETRLDAFSRRLAALEQDQAALSGNRLERASILLAIGRLADSGRLLNTLLAEQPANGRAHGQMAALLKRREGAPAALAYLRAIEPQIASEGDTLLLARLMHEAGESFAARGLLLREMQERPAPELCSACATIALAVGDADTFDKAVQAWLAADALDSWASRFAIAAARRKGAVTRLQDAAVPAEPATPLPVIQFWGQLPPPADVAETMASWHVLNPTVPHITFDSEGARIFIAESAPEGVLACYDAARHPAMQSDIFRLAFLARHGGVYVDADEICRRPIDDLQRALRRVRLAAWLSSDTPPYVFNGFLAAHSGCPIIAAALEESVRLQTKHRSDGLKTDIWQVTGPGLITRAIGRYVIRPEHAGEVLLLTDQEYRSFAHTVDLAYKQTDAGKLAASLRSGAGGSSGQDAVLNFGFHPQVLDQEEARDDQEEGDRQGGQAVAPAIGCAVMLRARLHGGSLHGRA